MELPNDFAVLGLFLDIMQENQINQRKSFGLIRFAFTNIRKNLPGGPRKQYAKVVGISTSVATLGISSIIRGLTILFGVESYWLTWTQLSLMAVLFGVCAYVYQLRNPEYPDSWEKLLEQLLSDYKAATPVAHAELVALVAVKFPLLPMAEVQAWFELEEAALTAELLKADEQVQTPA